MYERRSYITILMKQYRESLKKKKKKLKCTQQQRRHFKISNFYDDRLTDKEGSP